MLPWVGAFSIPQNGINFPMVNPGIVDPGVSLPVIGTPPSRQELAKELVMNFRLGERFSPRAEVEGDQVAPKL